MVESRKTESDGILGRDTWLAVGALSVYNFLTKDFLFFPKHLHEICHVAACNFSNNLVTSRLVTPAHGELVGTVFTQNISDVIETGDIRRLLQTTLREQPGAYGHIHYTGAEIDLSKLTPQPSANIVRELAKANANVYAMHMVAAIAGPLGETVASSALLLAGRATDRIRHPFWKSLFLLNAMLSSLCSLAYYAQNVAFNLYGDFAMMVDDARNVLTYGGTGNACVDNLARLCSNPWFAALVYALPNALIFGYSAYSLIRLVASGRSIPSAKKKTG